MSAVVWKFELQAEMHDYTMPAGAELLHVAMQRDISCIWIKCDPKAPPEQRRLLVTGTGHEFSDEGLSFVGSMLTDDGRFVFHVFEVRP